MRCDTRTPPADEPDADLHGKAELDEVIGEFDNAEDLIAHLRRRCDEADVGSNLEAL